MADDKVFQGKSIIRLTTNNRYATVNVECFPISEMDNKIQEFSEKYLKTIIKATLLIILGEDIESKEQQYLICKEYATSSAKDNCIRQMKRNYGDATEVSSSIITEQFKDLCWGKVINIFYEELKNIYVDDSNQDLIENLNQEPAEDISIVDEDKDENVEKSSENVQKSSKIFLQLAKKLPNEPYEQKTISETKPKKVDKKANKKKMICCGGR